VQVTRSFRPPIRGYKRLLEGILSSGQLTNKGELVQRLEKALAYWHGTNEVLFVGNGTIPLKLSIKSLDLSGKIITMPFSYLDSTKAILWRTAPRSLQIWIRVRSV